MNEKIINYCVDIMFSIVGYILIIYYLGFSIFIAILFIHWSIISIVLRLNKVKK